MLKKNKKQQEKNIMKQDGPVNLLFFCATGWEESHVVGSSHIMKSGKFAYYNGKKHKVKANVE